MKAPERVDEAAGLRIPPHSTEAEQSVLGGLLIDNSAWDRAGDLLTESDFYRSEHRQIYAAIGALVNASKPADVVTVFEHLQSLGKAEECGGMTYLNALAQSVPSAANLRRYAEIVRERAVLRKLVATADEIATNAFNPQGRAVSEILDEAEGKIFRIGQGRARSSLGFNARVSRQLGEVMLERIDRINDLHEGKIAPGWPTGIPWLDRMVKINPGKLIVIAARPAVGKTALAIQLALVFAGQALPVLALSQEMPSGELADRAISHIGRIDYERLQTGKLSEDDWGRLSEAVERSANLPLMVDDQPALRLADIRSKARRVRGLKVLIVDYLQLCAGSGGKDNRNAEIEEISRGLKALSKELDIAVIALSQLNRDVEKRADKRPMPSDLRDSGAIEQDADTIAFLWPVREFEAEGRRIIGLGIDKNRNGRRGEVGLDFFGATQRFGESTADIRPGKNGSAAGGGFE